MFNEIVKVLKKACKVGEQAVTIVTPLCCGRQIPYSRFFLQCPKFCKICEVRLTSQIFSARREIFLYFHVNKALPRIILSCKLSNHRKFCWRQFFQARKFWTHNNNQLYGNITVYPMPHQLSWLWHYWVLIGVYRHQWLFPSCSQLTTSTTRHLYVKLHSFPSYFFVLCFSFRIILILKSPMIFGQEMSNWHGV